MEPVEYAPTYGAAERRRLVALGVVLLVPAVAASKLWLFPWIAALPCRTVLGIPGATVLWYGLFVGLPMVAAVVAGVGGGYRGLNILRDGQCPPAGARVFRPARIVRGAAARRRGWLCLAAFVPFLAIAVWGYPQAVSLSQRSTAAACPAPVRTDRAR